MNELEEVTLGSDPRARHVFICALIIAVGVIYTAGSHIYFYSDEWTVLHDRSMTTLSGWLEPHNEVHWIPGLVSLYKVLFNLVGLDHYWVYHLPGVAMHLFAAWMLRQIMVNARVDEWTATACASVLVFFGAGAQNIMWAFQVGFVTSLAMGLVHLTCATHPTPTRRRDIAGLIAGAVALAFGGIGVTMAIIVGLATLLLRGWRVAFFHTAPLGIAYLWWWLNFAQGAVTHYGTPIQWAEWVGREFIEVFRALGGWAPLGVLLAAVTAIGIALRIRDQKNTVGWWRPLVPILALAVGAVVFQLITALGRVAQPLGGFIILGPAGAIAGRYIYIVAALLLPAIAIAVSYLLCRWRITALALVPVFAVSLVVNVKQLISIEKVPAFEESSQTNTRQLVSDAAYSDLIELVPAETRLKIPYATLTVAWLRAVKAQGHVPEVGGITPNRAAKAELQLATDLFFAKGVVCHEPIEAGVMLDFVAGDIIRYTGAAGAKLSFVYKRDGRGRAKSQPVPLILFNAVRVTAPQARLMFSTDDQVNVIERCVENGTPSCHFPQKCPS